MSQMIKGTDLSVAEKKTLFWASFFSLAAAGFGFAFRVAMGGVYGEELTLSNHEVGQIFGASLWPIAITMIGFSLFVDRTGYKVPMYIAFALQAISGVGTYMADSYGALYLFALCAGLGHGIVEAVINPICAAVYPKEKTKWLTILHAAWPFGLVFGTLAIICTGGMVDGWRIHALWILIPASVYAFMYRTCRFPVDERVQAGIPYSEMLRQVGFLTAALASFMMIYEIGNQIDALTSWDKPEGWFNVSLIAGVAVGAVFGFMVKGLGKPLFFLMCLLMIPVATAELGTDQWIGKLMRPVLDGMGLDAALAIVFSASIMLIFRVFAGGILSLVSPPTLLCLSGVFSAAGLYWLSGATGVAIFLAFTIYALGQTFYWPCVLGFTAERYPQGGALTLNTVSAIGLLSVGIIGGQLLGVGFDTSIHGAVTESAPELAAASSETSTFLGISHEMIDPVKKDAYIAGLSDEAAKASATEAFATADTQAGRDVLKYAVRFPGVLIIAFGLIALYFRSKGGYKPVVLTE
ncbi:MAG: MFS family permease [Planctomycetota bacterium]|jgi:MFS family permease